MKPDFVVSFPGLGINDLFVSRVVFTIFGLPVYWYGLLIAVAIILGMLLAMREAKKFSLSSDDVMDTFIALIPLMIVFARIYYVIFSWKEYSSDWTLIFDTRRGGLAFYGGVIGGALGIILVTRLKKIKISRLLDFLVVYVPLGQAIGRWGNFFNQEAFGNNTTLPWGMISKSASGTSTGTFEYLAWLLGKNPSLNLVKDNPVHPTFLYEFIANIIIFFVLYRIRKTSKTPFKVTLWYLMLYGFVRFFVEGIRTDPLMLGSTSIRVSQWLSALMVIVSAIVLVVLSRRRQRKELAAALAGEEFILPATDEELVDFSAFVEIGEEPASDFQEIEQAEDTASPAEKEAPPSGSESAAPPDDAENKD